MNPIFKALLKSKNENKQTNKKVSDVSSVQSLQFLSLLYSNFVTATTHCKDSPKQYC